jgi:hypothetical protein
MPCGECRTDNRYHAAGHRFGVAQGSHGVAQGSHRMAQGSHGAQVRRVQKRRADRAVLRERWAQARRAGSAARPPALTHALARCLRPPFLPFLCARSLAPSLRRSASFSLPQRPSGTRPSLPITLTPSLNTRTHAHARTHARTSGAGAAQNQCDPVEDDGAAGAAACACGGQASSGRDGCGGRRCLVARGGAAWCVMRTRARACVRARARVCARVREYARVCASMRACVGV